MICGAAHNGGILVRIDEDTDDDVIKLVTAISSYNIGKDTYVVHDDKMPQLESVGIECREDYSTEGKPFFPKLSIGVDEGYYLIKAFDSGSMDMVREAMKDCLIVIHDEGFFKFPRPSCAKEVYDVMDQAFRSGWVAVHRNIYNEILVESGPASVQPYTITEVPEGEKLFDYQEDGVSFCMQNREVIIGDAPGLGKTAQALMTVSESRDTPCLIVCPATLKVNWHREIQKWAQWSTWTFVCHGRKADVDGFFLSFPDFVICNYEIFDAWVEFFQDIPFRSVILDESHYVKNPKAKRTKSIRAFVKSLDLGPDGKLIDDRSLRVRKMLLSGTPAVNRPTELVPQLQIINRLKEFGGWKSFLTRYGGAKKNQYGQWEEGEADYESLHELLTRKCMIRRRKEDVLQDLPPKMPRTFFEIVPSKKDQKDYNDANNDIVAWLAKEYPKDTTKATAAQRAEAIVKINVLRQLSSKMKVKWTVDWAKDFLDGNPEDKLILFAHFRDSQHLLIDELSDYDPVAILGGQANSKTVEAIDLFQNDPDHRLIVCSLGAGGLGHTLTASSHVAMIDYGWSPAVMEQAEDRCHRIGQTEPVNPYYMHFDGSIDDYMQQLIEGKRKVISEVLDGDETPPNAVDFVIRQLRGDDEFKVEDRDD